MMVMIKIGATIISPTVLLSPEICLINLPAMIRLFIQPPLLPYLVWPTG
jgi:hypothetical protein